MDSLAAARPNMIATLNFRRHRFTFDWVKARICCRCQNSGSAQSYSGSAKKSQPNQWGLGSIRSQIFLDDWVGAPIYAAARSSARTKSIQLNRDPGPKATGQKLKGSMETTCKKRTTPT